MHNPRLSYPHNLTERKVHEQIQEIVSRVINTKNKKQQKTKKPKNTQKIKKQDTQHSLTRA